MGEGGGGLKARYRTTALNYVRVCASFALVKSEFQRAETSILEKSFECSCIGSWDKMFLIGATKVIKGTLLLCLLYDTLLWLNGSAFFFPSFRGQFI